jgi:hypothetical protein
MSPLEHVHACGGGFRFDRLVAELRQQRDRNASHITVVFDDQDGFLSSAPVRRALFGRRRREPAAAARQIDRDRRAALSLAMITVPPERRAKP